MSVLGRSWHARRIAGPALARTRASTCCSRPDGRGSFERSLTTRTRQVEQRARPPHGDASRVKHLHHIETGVFRDVGVELIAKAVRLFPVILSVIALQVHPVGSKRG